MAHDYRILIDGQLVKPVRGGTMEVINPADNTVVAVVPKCSEEDVELAVAAARRALPGWKGTYIGARSERLIRLAAILREHQDELVPLETAMPCSTPQSPANRFSNSAPYFPSVSCPVANTS